jgi:hypothetical protein
MEFGGADNLMRIMGAAERWVPGFYVIFELRQPA